MKAKYNFFKNVFKKICILFLTLVSGCHVIATRNKLTNSRLFRAEKSSVLRKRKFSIGRYVFATS
ncbi:hypothetical protein B6D60_00245 [candidate division KSB1 bacterium 4484_87]|nr:MAG: hypothetical protein B6D60_00245 [candidate division KSB1 bacterium 4484_87]